MQNKQWNFCNDGVTKCNKNETVACQKQKRATKQQCREKRTAKNKQKVNLFYANFYVCEIFKVMREKELKKMLAHKAV